MSDSNRLNKYEKRRKNTKTISLLLILGGILIIILLAIFLFGGSDEEAEGEKSATESTSENKNDSGNDATNDETNDDNTSEDKTDEGGTSPDDDSSNSDSDDPDKSDDQSADDENAEEKKPVDVSDPNVEEAYTKEWEPIGTEQEGQHTKQFVEESQDWKEMKEAIRVATGIEEGKMITWRIENGGGKDVIGTVSPDSAPDKTYQVNLTWVENEGWKPTVVKIIKDNPYD